MSRRDVRVVRVPRWVTISLLVLVSGVMAAALYALSGRAYAYEWVGLDLSRRTWSRSTILASLMPLLANAVIFMPWGFLFFLAVDPSSLTRKRTYLLTFLFGLGFAAALQLWQLFLPTRVTTLADGLANGLGAVAGALLAHVRKGVRFHFEV